MAKTAIEKLNTKKQPKIAPSLSSGIPWIQEGFAIEEQSKKKILAKL